MPNARKHKEKLVETAMRLFREQGYASTGLQQILTESGAPKGSLYHYFPGGKESLGEAAVKLAGARINEMLEGLATCHPRNAKAFVSGYCKVMAGWMKESEFYSGCPVATTLLETAPRSPTMTAVGGEVLDKWIDTVASVFTASGLPKREAQQRSRAAKASGAKLARPNK